MRANHLDAARAALQRALQLDEKLPGVRCKLATMCLKHNRRAEAAGHLLAEMKLDDPTVGRIRTPPHVAVPRESLDGERHGRDGHAEVLGEVGDAARIDGIEVAEYARLMRAQRSLSLGVPYVPLVAGEVDSWIGAEEALDVVHGASRFGGRLNRDG